MRSLVLSLIWLGGCQPPAPVDIAHKSELKEQTRGIVLNDNGEDGTVGVWTTTCEVYTDDGTMGGDFDVATNRERIEDRGENEVHDGGVVVASSTEGVHIMTDGGWGRTLDVPVPNVVDAKVHPKGVAVLYDHPVDGCQVAWVRNRKDRESVGVDAGYCSGGLAVDAQSGRLWVGGSDRVAAIDTDGEITEVVDGGQLVALDEVTEALYVAQRRSKTVRALELDGAERWVTEVPGEITAIDDMGQVGAVAVMVEHGNGTGELVFVDGWTDEIRSEVPTPGAAKELTVSRNGKVMALTLSGAVHFYEVSEPKL